VVLRLCFATKAAFRSLLVLSGAYLTTGEKIPAFLGDQSGNKRTFGIEIGPKLD